MVSIKELHVGDIVIIDVWGEYKKGYIESIAPRYTPLGNEYMDWEKGCIVKLMHDEDRVWEYVEDVEKAANI